MIFTSQSGLSDPTREVEWDAWYAEHLRIMTTVPGITSAQRLKTTGGCSSPSLAMYTVVSAEVFADPYYQRVRGMGEWLPLIDKAHYRRNLFDGLDTAPDVPGGSVLIVADRDQPQEVALPLTWLRSAGLDRSTAYRGIAVVARAVADALSTDDVAVYRPVSPRITSPAPQRAPHRRAPARSSAPRTPRRGPRTPRNQPETVVRTEPK